MTEVLFESSCWEIWQSWRVPTLFTITLPSVLQLNMQSAPMRTTSTLLFEISFKRSPSSMQITDSPRSVAMSRPSSPGVLWLHNMVQELTKGSRTLRSVPDRLIVAIVKVAESCDDCSLSLISFLSSAWAKVTELSKASTNSVSTLSIEDSVASWSSICCITLTIGTMEGRAMRMNWAIFCRWRSDKCGSFRSFKAFWIMTDAPFSLSSAHS